MKSSTKDSVEQLWRNKAAQPAQRHTFADRIMQMGGGRGHSPIDHIGYGARLVSIRGALLDDLFDSLPLLRVGVEGDSRGSLVFADTGFCEDRFDQQGADPKLSDFVIECLGVALERMFARGVNPTVRRWNDTDE